jgi:hypothetical protein
MTSEMKLDKNEEREKPKWLQRSFPIFFPRKEGVPIIKCKKGFVLEEK